MFMEWVWNLLFSPLFDILEGEGIAILHYMCYYTGPTFGLFLVTSCAIVGRAGGTDTCENCGYAMIGLNRTMRGRQYDGRRVTTNKSGNVRTMQNAECSSASVLYSYDLPRVCSYFRCSSMLFPPPAKEIKSVSPSMAASCLVPAGPLCVWCVWRWAKQPATYI